MTANSSITLSNLDFDTLKSTYKSYLKTQDIFKDYDFEGSNMNVLLDLLSYNTYHNAFYLNMVGNEMFMDSALLRDSVVSHSKELNYTPRSFKSSEALVDIFVTSTNLNRSNLLIPKGFTFSSSFFNKSFSFSTDDNILLTDYTQTGNKLTFKGSAISVYEGVYLTDTFIYTNEGNQRYIISNKNVDTSSISVTVIEDSGEVQHTYRKALSLFDLDSESKVFFIQGAEGDSYELVFGDGITGRKPKHNSVILIQYRVSSGQLSNGCNRFDPDSTIDRESTISVVTVQPARGGSVSESIESIKYNAPRYFTTQERAVTTEDYETLLKIQFPEINAVTAFGGEDLNPPQFGKVFIAVDLVDVDGLPDIKKTEYFKFLRPRSPVSILPVFVNPDYTYLGINSNIVYNLNITRLSQDDLKVIVSSAILEFANETLNDFNRTFRYSQLVRKIDSAQISIVSNQTSFNIIKLITNPSLGEFLTFDVPFNIPLDVVYNTKFNTYSIRSSEIVFGGIRAVIQDDGKGNLFAISSATNTPLQLIGTCDYEKGLLQFSNFKIDNIFGPAIKLYAQPKDKDISTINNVILNILPEDINITANSTRV